MSRRLEMLLPVLIAAFAVLGLLWFHTSQPADGRIVGGTYSVAANSNDSVASITDASASPGQSDPADGCLEDWEEEEPGCPTVSSVRAATPTTRSVGPVNARSTATDLLCELLRPPRHS